jgi:hypothetical protein
VSNLLSKINLTIWGVFLLSMIGAVFYILHLNNKIHELELTTGKIVIDTLYIKPTITHDTLIVNRVEQFFDTNTVTHNDTITKYINNHGSIFIDSLIIGSDYWINLDEKIDYPSGKSDIIISHRFIPKQKHFNFILGMGFTCQKIPQNIIYFNPQYDNYGLFIAAENKKLLLGLTYHF